MTKDKDIDDTENLKTHILPDMPEQIKSTEKEVIEKYAPQAIDLDLKKEVRMFIKKEKRILWKVGRLGKFRQPLLLQQQPNGQIKVMEDVPAGIYKFDIGNEKGIHILHGGKMYELPYGNDTVKCFMTHAHYLHAFPQDLYEDSIQTEKLISRLDAVKKAVHGKGWADFSWGTLLITLAIAIAIILFAWGMWGPEPQTIQTIVVNATGGTP